MKNKGISLIVLIITCVTIIILATAIIVNIAQTNMIENAKEAVVKQDFKTMQDELNMYKADKYVETHGNFKAENLDITNKEQIAEIMPSIVGTKYEAYVLIEDGCIAISDEMPEQERKWAMEAVGLIKTSTNRPTESKPTATPVIAVNTIVETSNSTITGSDFAYSNPVIPVGFKAIETADATWIDEDGDGSPDGWNNGLVIQDDNLNEFVWVPCTLDGRDGSAIYTKNIDYPSFYTATIENTKDDIQCLPMKDSTTSIEPTEQIENYEGFYIGRYESGVSGENVTPSDSEGIPTVQRGATVWTDISYNNAMPNSKKMYESSTSVRSGIVTGTARDTVYTWIHSEKDSNGNILHDVTNSVSWGNYAITTGKAQYDTNGITKISGSMQTAGYSEYWKAKNIYDLAGNTWEWTGELYGTSCCITRGGFYLDNGIYCAASYRGGNELSHTNYGISFRIMLYVM